MSKQHSNCSSGCGHHHAHDHRTHHEHDHEGHDENHWFKAILGLGFGTSLFILSFAGIVLSMPWLFALTLSSTALTFYLGFNTYKSAFKAFSQGQLNQATLYTISTLTLVTLGILGLFIPGLVTLGESAPMVLGFWHLGEGIEHSLADELEEKLDILDCLPKHVKRGEESVSVEDLQVFNTIEIEPGMIFPVDSILMTPSWLQTTRIDGAAHPKYFEAGSVIKSGMQLPKNSPSIQVWVSKPYVQSHLFVESENIQRAHKEKAPIEVLTDRILKYFIPTILGISILSGILIANFFTPFLAVQCATAVLVSACPCVLKLMTPMTVRIAIKKSSDIGVRIKDGKAIEAAAEVDDVVFDMNGTLTEGRSKVTQFWLSDERYAAHLALLERRAKHSFGKAIKTYVTETYKPSLGELKLKKLDTSHHSGLKAEIDGETFLVGDENMLASHGIEAIASKLQGVRQNRIYFVKDKTVIGEIEIQDKIRPDALSLVRALHQQGKRVHMATGGSLAAAKIVATELGIPHTRIYANSSEGARSKVDYIQFWQDKGRKVCMVGDSANDAPAIACADLGIAVKSPTAHAITEYEAGIVVSEGHLFPIAQTFQLVREAKNTMLLNLSISLTYNVSITLFASGLFLGSGFMINPVIGVALAILESVIIFGILFSFKTSQLKTEDEVIETQSAHTNSLFGFFSSLVGYAEPDLGQEDRDFARSCP